jgi:hypothetical protein
MVMLPIFDNEPMPPAFTPAARLRGKPRDWTKIHSHRDIVKSRPDPCFEAIAPAPPLTNQYLCGYALINNSQVIDFDAQLP